MEILTPPSRVPRPAAPAATTRPAAEPVLWRSLAAALSRPALDQAAAAFCAELAQALGCARVALAVAGPEDLALAGSSDAVPLQHGHPAANAVLMAMQESADQQHCVAWPAGPEQDLVCLAHRQLADAGAACSVPLVNDTAVVGVFTLERSQPFDAAELALLESVARLAGPVFELKRQLQEPWRRRLARELRERLRAPSRRRRAWGAAAALLVTAALVPLPWRVSAPARLEGGVQRAVVAATDGFLQQANVRPGDRVRAGQVLAELAAQDLELERRRRESELRQHESAYRAAQANADRTQMVSYQAKAAETQAVLSLVETQLQRARIEAPFDGIVIKGDLSQNLGGPVQRGEVLMVLAPDGSFRLILEVDERDIALVHPGQTGRLALAAQPDQPLEFVTRRVVPMAANADGRTFFEVEAALTQSLPQLRPGLSGVAKVGVGARPLAWVFGRRAIDWLRLAWWKLTPW